MKVYGLTGGTGSGKSEAAKRFREHGIPVIDADRLGHELIAPGGAAENAVRKAFGDKIGTCGKIDREKLGRIVFADPNALERLNAIIQPAIRTEIGRRCALLAAEQHHTVIIDAALIGDAGKLEPWLQALILVTTPKAERMRRLVAQRGISADDAQRRIAAQVPPESKVSLARWIIENDGSLQELRVRVDEIAEALYGLSLGS